MTRASNIVPPIPVWRQQCNPADSGNKPAEVRFLDRHQFSIRPKRETRFSGMEIRATNLMQLLLAGCALVFIAGCATDPTPMGSRFVVSAPAAQFYKNGPTQDAGFAEHTFSNYLAEQARGPDFQLPKGATVTMLKREPGYSKVVTDNGVAGYVANDQLKPAPAVARATVTEVPTERSVRQRTRANPPSRKNEEQLDLSDIPLPLPS
jgi:hypothetical protein